MPSSTPTFNLTGKTAIVTGASSGLGVAFSEALAQAGARVVIGARRVDKLARVAESITAAGGTALPVACDVTEPAQVEAMAAAALDRFGSIDILVNNAGVASDALYPPENVPNHLFEQTVRANLLGVWYCAKACAAPMLRQHSGSIINVASIMGIGGVGDFPPAYQSTKAAVIQLTRNLACSWGNRNVRVNALAPGWFTSEMTAGVEALQPLLDYTKRAAPMGRWGRLDELTGALLFLASDISSFVTGHTLVVDGGYACAMGHIGLSQEVYDAFEAVAPGGLGRRIGI